VGNSDDLALPRQDAAVEGGIFEHRLVAILMADMVGYSRLMGEDERETHRQMREQRQSVIDTEVASNNGKITQIAGDALLAQFPSIIGAVQCAINIQQKLKIQNQNLPPSRQMVWRIGINFGDVVVEPDDIYGNDINIAARLENLAQPGGICISERVYSEIRNKVDMQFHSIGHQWLKNISEPIHVYQSNPGSDSPSAAAESFSSQSPHEILDRPSIAILPFTNLMPNQDKQYLVDGVTEDLTTNFSMSPEFFVISQVSSFKFKSDSESLGSIARKLGVRYVVTGSVQLSQEGFRVTAQLIEASTGLQLWASRYNRANAELMEIRDEITRSIAATLMTTDGQIAKAELRRQTNKPAESFSVYDHYLKGRYLLHRSLYPPWEAGKKFSEMAKAVFSKLIQSNPVTDLPLNAGLAWQHAIDFDWEYGDPEESIRLAFDNAVIAVKQWPDNHLSQWVMGWAYLFAKRDYVRAMYHYNRARELNLCDSRLLAEMAQPLIYTGEYQRAIDLLNQAIRLNPLHEQWYDEFLAWAYEEIGEPEKTIELLRNFRELEGLSGYGVMARACFTTGRIEQFRDLIETMSEISHIQTGKHFSAEFWEHWVRQKEPYQDPARTDRAITTIVKGLEEIGW